MLWRMDHVTFLEEPSLDRPPVVCAFRGWNDGGEAASLALRHLVESLRARPLANLDPEEFYDFQVSRPMVRLEDGVSRVIEWPRGEFWSARAGGRDLVLFHAAEPNVRWRTFSREVVATAKAVGSGLLVTLGAFLTDVPHTREVPVVGSAADEGTAARLGLARSRYEGPTGIVGVLHDLSNHSGLPSISLWAAVPHYLPAAANPKAALALVRRAAALLEIPVDTTTLERTTAAWEEGIEALVAGSDDLSEYLHRLEEASDEPSEPDEDQDVPSGESIAAELERFLREQGPGGQGSLGRES
jgi:predicted ATP-grasp superfamily ATP-dependent carboligase